MDEELPQYVRLEAAAHIKAIEDSGDRFSARDAEALADLLQDMPMAGIGMEMEIKSKGPKIEGSAAGHGKISVEGEEKQRKWSIGEKEFRCGSYVVRRGGKAIFDIRHVGNVDADQRDGYLLRIRKDAGEWKAYLNRPRQFRIWPFVLTIGGRFDLWKRSA